MQPGDSATAIDIPSANGVHFTNVASGGFGAEVTVGTNPQLKKALGGGAYALTGLVTAAKMTPYEGRLKALRVVLPEGCPVLQGS